MLPTAIIVFRETLEAALIIGIVLAAAKGVVGRGRWVGLGIAGGILGAAIAALFAGAIADAAEGMGQELFNAAVLFVAVFMLGWHSIWMSRHGREMAADMKATGQAVASGIKPIRILAIVVGVAVLREGSETVLFLAGIAASNGGSVLSMAGGGALGLAAGALIGLALYLGLIQIPMRFLFGVTTALVILLASGMASQGAAFLVQAGYIRSLTGTAWNSSWILSEGSVIGRILHTLIGYADRPMMIQVCFYVATLVVIGTLTWLARNKTTGRKPQPAAQAAQ